MGVFLAFIIVIHIIILTLTVVRAEDPVTQAPPLTPPTTPPPPPAEPAPAQPANNTQPASGNTSQSQVNQPKDDKHGKTDNSKSKAGLQTWQGLSPVLVLILTGVFHSLLY